MGKIEKEKLLEEFRGIGSMYLSDVRRVIKNFPEEQEIDFDALWKEYEEKYSCKKTTNCDNCTYPNKLYYTTICFVDFLKSKNLTVPKLVDIPVKKTWTLKEKYHEYHLKMCIGTMVDVKVDEEPKYPEYYDYQETIDYSKIPKGSIVEIECLGDKFYRTFVKFEHENIFTKDGEEIEQWSPTLIIRIVELAKGVSGMERDEIKIGLKGNYAYFKNITVTGINDKHVIMSDVNVDTKEVFKSLFLKYFKEQHTQKNGTVHNANAKKKILGAQTA